MMTATSILDRARAYAAAIPGAVSGAGGDKQTFKVACALVHGFALADDDALILLREYNLRCQPPWKERELVRKVESARSAGHLKPRGHLIGGNPLNLRASSARRATAPAAEKIDPSTAIKNHLRGFHCTAADLTAASPCSIPPLICGPHFHRQGAYLLDQLFDPGERVNIVTHAIVENGKARPGDAGLTLERNEWQRRLLDKPLTATCGAWLRMNPLDGRGVSDVNVTAFRFALIECDTVPLELQLPLLARLPLPIAAILTSGGRSIHAWVLVDAATEEDYRQTVARMLALLAKFDVDGNNKNPSRLSRLPGVVWRIGAEAARQQRLLYLNPKPTQKPIL